MPDLREATQKTIEEGERRLKRSFPMLLSTGTVGGIDVGIGVFALLLVEADTGNTLLASLAFSIGFIALSMANSELFTENFLVPIAAVAARRATPQSVLRLWGGTLVTNLIGGWIITLIFMKGLPELRAAAIDTGAHFVQQGVGWGSFATAVLAGTIITLMTWMEHSTESMPARLAAAIAAAFLLAGGRLNHAIVMSLDMFAALHVTAPFGYLDWFRLLCWAALGNAVGGIALVTVLRLTQMHEQLASEGKEPSEA